MVYTYTYINKDYMKNENENDKDLVKNLGVLGLGVSSDFNFMSPEDKLKELKASAIMVFPHMHIKNGVNSPTNKIPTEEEVLQMLKEAESQKANDSNKLVSKEELLEKLQVKSSKGGDYTNIINQIKSIRVDVKHESNNDKNKSLK